LKVTKAKALLWVLALLVALSCGGCGTGGMDAISTDPPPGYDPDAGPFLARGTWDYSGSGEAEALNIVCDAFVRDGLSTIESTGEAGSETVTAVDNRATVVIDCPLRSWEETLTGRTEADEDVVDNRVVVVQQGLTFEYFLLSDREARAHLYGTRDVSGTTATVNLWLTCTKRAD
jgi:hypothetical protein